MKHKKYIIGGILGLLLVTSLIVAGLLERVPSQIEIERLENFEDYCVMVYVKGYSDRYIPCVEYNLFTNDKEFEIELKKMIAEIDYIELNPTTISINPNENKLNDIKSLEGSILQK